MRREKKKNCNFSEVKQRKVLDLVLRIDTKLLLHFSDAAAPFLGDQAHELSANVLDVVVVLQLGDVGFDL